MIKLNIQLFGGDTAVDHQDRADSDGDGVVTIPGLNGETYKVPATLFSRVDADSGRNSNADEEIREAKVWMSYYLTYGEVPTNTIQLTKYGRDIGLGTREVRHDAKSGAYHNYILPGLKDAMATGRITDTTGRAVLPDGVSPDEVSTDAVENAYNQYYNDIMAYDQEGTFGNAILNNQVSLKTKEADNAAMLAEANLQSQALGQAQSVRDVVNSLKSERMSQLRAGMNQAQLADRELQMLVGSAGQLAQQNQMARQDAVAADLGKNTAYETAFNDYITQAQALGQNATANYAALVGDSVTQAKLLEEAKKKNPGFINSFNQATGNTTPKS